MHRDRVCAPAPRRRVIIAALASMAIAPHPPAHATPPSSWDIVELGAGVDPAVSTGALAINDAGIAAGWLGDVPALFTPEGRAERLGDRAGRALGFDREGRVVGRFLGTDDGPPVAFVGRDAVLMETPSIELVDSLAATSRAAARLRGVALPGAFFSQAYGRNRAGDVVGTSDTGAGTPQRAVMLPGRLGQVIDLSELADVRAAGWRLLLVAYAINDRRALVGVGTRGDGALRGFMLRPRSPRAGSPAPDQRFVNRSTSFSRTI